MDFLTQYKQNQKTKAAAKKAGVKLLSSKQASQAAYKDLVKAYGKPKSLGDYMANYAAPKPNAGGYYNAVKGPAPYSPGANMTGYQKVPKFTPAQQPAPTPPATDTAPTQPTAPAPGTQPQTYLPVPTYEAPAGPNMEDLASQFAASIAEMQAGLMESFAAQQENFMQMQMAQDEKMQTLMSNIAQATAAQQDRPAVAGVKTAVGSSGDQMQIARRGVSGNFGRLGLRIKNLNV